MIQFVPSRVPLRGDLHRNRARIDRCDMVGRTRVRMASSRIGRKRAGRELTGRTLAQREAAVAVGVAVGMGASDLIGIAA
jgi:hypothetical protein